MRIAAVQPATVVANVDANMEECERLANEAARQGAQWIALPEFFTTGMAFVPKIADCVLPPDGRATQFLLSLARRHGANVSGSFLCKDADGHVRNAFLIATPQGIAGRHDKDIPTMWENCFYVGGTDDGVLSVGDLDVGASLCFEFNRGQTVRRLRGKVDLVVGGSCKWGAPRGFPAALQREIERFTDWTPNFARLMGCPVIEASHCGRFRCPMPILGMPYLSEWQGLSTICDARGKVLARRSRVEGAGVIVAEIEPGSIGTSEPIPDRFWLVELDLLSEYLGWRTMNWHGKRWYLKHGPGAQRGAAAGQPPRGRP
ncbi:MAG: carbon-nitrogen hydrolase family protein [Pseudomonadota bacterium]